MTHPRGCAASPGPARPGSLIVVPRPRQGGSLRSERCPNAAITPHIDGMSLSDARRGTNGRELAPRPSQGFAPETRAQAGACGACTLHPTEQVSFKVGSHLRFTSFRVENFRGIRSLNLDDLQDLVLVAGPNGCGKSCILDAMRLLKSLYGGYQANEYQMWLGEFGINPNTPGELSGLLRDSNRSMVIEAAMELSEREVRFLHDRATQVVVPLVWREIANVDVRGVGFHLSTIPLLQIHGDAVANRAAERAEQLKAELSAPSFKLRIEVNPLGHPLIHECLPIQMVFENYEPGALGVLEYHSASRIYEREAVGGVNLNLDAVTEQRRTQSLYNWREKYKNVKSELAAHYVRETIAQKSGVAGRFPDLNETLTALFEQFFPDKSYHGPRASPAGLVDFPVWIDGKPAHDIDELSSGEKELVYGYLRLRNSAPHSSVLLIDEPELHLNPRLLQGMPDFYHKYLGSELGNQLWLVTHSDALLRQAVGRQTYSVFHMASAAGPDAPDSQAIAISANDEMERAVVDIVGDLAAYRPRGKVVIVEGDPDSAVDVEIIGRLFPEFEKRVNLVSGGNKSRVRDLYAVLSQAAEDAGLADRFYAITDRDHSSLESAAGDNVMKWDSYHIENYLLDPSYLRKAILAVRGTTKTPSEQDIEGWLLSSAKDLVERLVLEFLQGEVNDRLVSSIRVGANPTTRTPASDLIPSIKGSAERVAAAAHDLVTTGGLEEREAEFRESLIAALDTGTWKKEFPGRRLLNSLVDQHLEGISYVVFRNLVLDKMAEASYRPAGMAEVLEAVVKD